MNRDLQEKIVIAAEKLKDVPTESLLEWLSVERGVLPTLAIHLAIHKRETGRDKVLICEFDS